MEPLSSLHLLAEAVRNAGADIAPAFLTASARRCNEDSGSIGFGNL